jgi:hypothetical protein
MGNALVSADVLYRSGQRIEKKAAS